MLSGSSSTRVPQPQPLALSCLTSFLRDASSCSSAECSTAALPAVTVLVASAAHLRHKQAGTHTFQAGPAMCVLTQALLHPCCTPCRPLLVQLLLQGCDLIQQLGLCCCCPLVHAVQLDLHQQHIGAVSSASRLAVFWNKAVHEQQPATGCARVTPAARVAAVAPV